MGSRTVSEIIQSNKGRDASIAHIREGKEERDPRQSNHIPVQKERGRRELFMLYHERTLRRGLGIPCTEGGRKRNGIESITAEGRVSAGLFCSQLHIGRGGIVGIFL